MRHIGDACRDTSLSVQNDLSACRRQKFFEHFGVERAPSTSLSVHNNISSCRRQNFFCLFGFERAPSAYLSVHYNILSACLRYDFFSCLALKGPPQPISQFTITEVLARQEIFGRFDFERALLTSLSVHNNISACRRQNFFGPLGF